MLKITIIGAGSLVFTRNLCNDILLTPALQDCTITLMDIDAVRLAQARDAVQSIVDRLGLPVCVEATLDQREAVTGAQYVITTFQQGGLEAFRLDIEIPQRYGVEQCIGDTLGPGGVFRGLRSIPVLRELCRDMDDLAPDALLLNYVNPMSINCWALEQATNRPYVGLCHSVQGTSKLLATWIGVSHSQIVYLCAGINHQAFFLEFRQGDEDLYPRIREAGQRLECFAQEPVRVELMNHFGYFVTESSAHASEYVPYFRKNTQMVNGWLVPLFKSDDSCWHDYGRTGGYLRECLKMLNQSQSEADKLTSNGEKPPRERTHEYGSYIMEAIETNHPIRINGNVVNHGLITNLPQGCCVEVPCLVDGNGIQPITVGALPPQLAALMRSNVNVQELTVEAALTGNCEAVYYAAMLDPLTAAACTLPKIRAMVDELMTAQARWLPEFQQ